MTDEMELAVLKIKFRALEQDFLNLVFADEIDSAGNSMIYKLDRNSLCHRHELHFLRVSAALQRGFGYLVANLFRLSSRSLRRASVTDKFSIFKILSFQYYRIVNFQIRHFIFIVCILFYHL